MAADTAGLCAIEPNTDIMGIGIRVSSYILALCAPLAAHLLRSEELVDSMETAMGITGLAILLTAIIYEAQGNLDLFHGLCVFNLVSLVGFAIAPKARSDSDDDDSPAKSSNQLKVTLYYAGFLAFLGYSIHLFATAPRFGSSSAECNNMVVIVLLGVTFPATENILRWFLVAMLSALAVAAAVAYFFKPDFYGSTEGPNWPVAVEECAARAYLISNLELTIRNNQVADGSDIWSFGQIMSMILLIGPLVEFVAVIMAWRQKDPPGQSGDQDAEQDAEQSDGQAAGSERSATAPAPRQSRSAALRRPQRPPKGAMHNMRHESKRVSRYTTGAAEVATWQQSFFWRDWSAERWVRFWLFGAGVAALDMAACTLAGVATAAAGAHVNGDAVTSQLMSLGALAGAIKSGVRSFCVFVSLHTSSPATLSLKFLLFSWGLALFVTNAVVQRIMFPVPEGLLVAAVASAAAGPFWYGSMDLWASRDWPNISQFIEIIDILEERFMKRSSLPVLLVFDIGSGLIFAKVAADYGWSVCSLRAAAAAAAVWSSTYWLGAAVPVLAVQMWRDERNPGQGWWKSSFPPRLLAAIPISLMATCIPFWYDPDDYPEEQEDEEGSW